MHGRAEIAMNSKEAASELVKDLQEAFNEAEREIHRSESVTQRAPVSALNELRYAGSHMLVYLQEGHQEELTQATMHGRRAFYDAQRFTLLFLMRDAQAIRNGIGEFISLYVSLVSRTHGANKYGELKKNLISAKAYIQQLAQIKSDSKRWQNRGENYAACKPHIRALREYIDVYESLSDEFARARDEEVEHKRRIEQDRRRKFILAVLGLILAMLGVIATLVAACF